MRVSLLLGAAVCVSLVYGLLNPFADRLHGASLFAGRALTPKELAVSAPLGLQPALVDGWPSNVIFIVPNLLWVAVILGLFYAWWASALVLIVGIWMSTIISIVAGDTLIAPRALERYLMILLNHALQRSATYSAKGDSERAQIAEDLARQIGDLHRLYIGSHISAPTYTEARKAPFGNPAYLLQLAEHSGQTE